ncbi:hypothetical protein [Moraxella lacunata]|uniref:hypothetical protein n=1 Tax=Moraxella lacunata TaxID=477 RepID=UPI003EE39A0E
MSWVGGLMPLLAKAVTETVKNAKAREVFLKKVIIPQIHSNLCIKSANYTKLY